MTKKKFKLLVPIFTFILSIICLEVVLSFFYPRNNTYYVFNPGEKASFPLDTIVLRGVSDTSNVYYNGIGARSDEIPLLKHRKIIAFGGSTTECITIDQKNTWTELLETSLNKNSDSIRYWVGNFGKSGNSTNHNILQTKEILAYKALEDVETVLYLLGFNDLTYSEGFKEKHFIPNLHETKLSAFSVFPDKELPFYQRTGIWKFLKSTKREIDLNRFYKEKIANIYLKSRDKRKRTKKNKVIPDLTIGLHHYRKNINTLIDICASRGKKPVFITQPVLWRPDITEEGKNISPFLGGLNFGSLNNLDIESLYICMKIFNDTLLEVCKENNVKCIDLAQYSEESWFYDNCHYNEKGAREVAKIIYNNIGY